MKFMVLHMGRSGGHAIIRWIAQGLDGTVILENNCVNGWSNKKHIPNKKVKMVNQGEGSHVIRNIEDLYLPLWKSYHMDAFDRYDCKIIIIRSFDNWLASSIAADGWAKDYLSIRPRHRPIELPVCRLEAYLHYDNVANNPFSSFTRISYDEWYASDSYRDHIAKLLTIKNTEMPKHCKFSSFGKNRDYIGDRKSLLNNSQKALHKRLSKLYTKLKGV